jgi:hypothetical protein
VTSPGEGAERVGNAVCETCGARASRIDQTFCAYCGGELPRLVRGEPDAVSTGGGEAPHANLEQRFAALQAHPDYAAAQSHEPSAAREVTAHVGGAIFGVVFTIVALVIFGGSGAAGAPLAMRLVPLLFAVFGVAMVVKSLSQGARLAKAPLVREPRVVVDKRTHVRGTGESTRTTYFVTLEGTDARRVEARVPAALYGQVRSGDMGVSFRRGDRVIDFERIPV